MLNMFIKPKSSQNSWVINIIEQFYENINKYFYYNLPQL
jgi:hypothetical protein